jgi:hypothetical protein
MDGAELVRLHDQLEGYRQPWERLWEKVSQLVLPMRDDYSGYSPAQQRNLQQYDSFPMGALDKFAAALEAGLTPRTAKWHRLSTGEESIDNDHSVKLFLEELNNRIWKTRYAPMSAFVGQSNEKRLDLGLFGTGCLLVEAAQNGSGIRYQTIPLSEIWIDVGHLGRVDVVHRKFTLTARQAVQKFRERTPGKIMDKHNAGKVNETFEFLHCVRPLDDDSEFPGRSYGGWYVCLDSKEIVREEGFYESPYIVSRYAVATRERYGRSPAIQRLPDISMLNEMKRTVIEAAAMTVDPPLMSHEDVSEFDLVPGAVNPGTMDDNGRPMVQPFSNRIEPGITRELMADVRDQIDDGFLGLYFRVLLENPNMTATQAMLIAQQQGQMTMPVVGRLQAEWLGPMIRRESGILYRQGKHPEMPDVLTEYLQSERQPLQIEYESPLTRAAQAEDGIAMLRAFEGMAPLAQIDPSVFDVLDAKEAARTFMEVNGVPAKVMRSREDVERQTEEGQAMQEAATLLQAAPVAAQTAKTLAEAQKISGSSPAVPGGA